MNSSFFAHSANPAGQRQLLVEHCQRVATLAATFAEDLHAKQIAYYAGLWHDVGKFDPRWQQYLVEVKQNPERRGTGPDHKAAGVMLAQQSCPFASFLVHGHHGGLSSKTEIARWLAEKRAASGGTAAITGAIERARREIAELEPSSQLSMPDYIRTDALAAEFWLRLVFSALVDADYLDTERHFNELQSEQRAEQEPLAQLWTGFAAFHQDLPKVAVASPVNTVRQEVYASCLESAAAPPGIFELNVPTGGGKTLSGMAFALQHALKHGQRRVIVAVPYISITEQTAQTYREAFAQADQNAVLEHHSQVTLSEGAQEDFRQAAVWNRLAAENWDAPIVVTTAVQLFESLFHNSTSRTRKLHRLAQSVIILDEAQALPAQLLEPILDGLRQLTAHYGTTVVISTATQPAFESIPGFQGLAARPIIERPERHFAALQRVRYEWQIGSPLEWDAAAGLLRERRQGLAILNTKRQALALLDALGGDALHLSTLLCGAHRRYVIGEVKRRLKAGLPCILVSTQVVEAGVDIDFPFVLRALGPLDSLIQAAGRCNREGRLAEKGRLVVFLPPADMPLAPPGIYRTATDVTRALLGSGLDPNVPDNARAYFKRLFETIDTDGQDIQETRARLDYPEVARLFRMIPDDTESVVVEPKHVPGLEDVEGAQRDVEQVLGQLRRGSANARVLLRDLQPYVVSVRHREAQGYKQRGLIEPLTESLGRWLGRYDPVRGLVAAGMDLEALVI